MTDDPLTRIHTLADELTDPRINREPYTIWVGGHRKLQEHITVQHGLLTQLYRAVLPTQTAGDEPGSAIPTSRPPLEVEALSRHDQITAAARDWSYRLAVIPRGTPESTIRGLAATAAQADKADQEALAADLRRWTGWCRVYLGVEHIHTARGVRCPLSDCQALGSLRVNLTTSHGLCVACSATWDRDNIGVLAEHIRTSRAAKIDTEREGATA